MAVHHGALDIQLMIVGNSKVNRCHICKYCYQYDDAAFSCILDRLSHSDVVSGTVIDHICLVRAKCFHQSFSEIFLFRVYADINAALFCFCKTEIADIGDHNFGCAHSLGSLCNKVSDRTCADHCDIHSLYIAHLLHCMICNSQRLDHSAFLIGHLFRNRGNLGCIYRKIFRSSSCCLEAHNLQFLTEVILSMAAWIAMSAVYLWLDGNFLANLKPCHIFSKFRDLTGNLMSLCHRIFGKRMLAVVYMDVRSTDTNVHDLNKNLVIFYLRNRYLSENNLSWICHYLLNHCFFLLADLYLPFIVTFINYFIKVIIL